MHKIKMPLIIAYMAFQLTLTSLLLYKEITPTNKSQFISASNAFNCNFTLPGPGTDSFSMYDSYYSWSSGQDNKCIVTEDSEFYRKVAKLYKMWGSGI